MGKLKTKKDFIDEAKTIHGNKYDYSKVDYKGNKVKVCIVCPKHGEFWQTPNSHLMGNGCQKCYDERRGESIKKDVNYFIKKAKEIHGDKYDYSKVEYRNARTKVCIICPKHGEFWQTPSSHLASKGCKMCGNEKKSDSRKDNKDSFIEKARKKHGDKYDYSKVNYNDSQTKVCIICPRHGEFLQKPNTHLNGCGCPKCSKSHKLSLDEFIKKARAIHGDKYDYSKVEYKNARTKVCIVCPKHGEFWQRVSDHLNNKCGCPICSQSHLENKTYLYLNEHDVEFEKEKMFNWLGRMSLDFYLPNHNIAIECQGEQHYKPIDFAGKGIKWANELFENNKKRDKLKKQLCEEHGIKIIYIDNNTDFNELKNLIF